MYNTEAYIALIKERLSEYRFHHSMCVADKAKELAVRFGADEEKAYIAGILHDIMKEESKKEQRKIIKKAGFAMTELEKNNKKLYHQISGAAYMKCKLGINDEDILNSVRYHTTARADMSILEQCVYLADYISDDRDYDDVDVMRQKVQEGRESGLMYAFRYNIVDLVNKGKPIHPNNAEAYNWMIDYLSDKH